MVYDVNLALPCVPMIIEEPREGNLSSTRRGRERKDSSGIVGSSGDGPRVFVVVRCNAGDQ